MNENPTFETKPELERSVEAVPTSFRVGIDILGQALLEQRNSTAISRAKRRAKDAKDVNAEYLLNWLQKISNAWRVREELVADASSLRETAKKAVISSADRLYEF